MHQSSRIPVVLTGTIVPNVPDVKHKDWMARRAEYLTAIDYYRMVAPVYFLENSSYDVASDDAFVALPNVVLRQFPVSDETRRGKGYQEFELLDRWVASERPMPRRWIKVTGRYLYQNIGPLLATFRRDTDTRMVIDRYRRSGIARTGIFCVDTDFYRATLAGLYRECNDDAGLWVEHVVYRRLEDMRIADSVRTFAVEPGLRGISGTWGKPLWAGTRHYRLKVLARQLNRLLDQRYLWF
jgi:hypothetical protein